MQISARRNVYPMQRHIFGRQAIAELVRAFHAEKFIHSSRV
jgi:hypothetical protein